MRQPLLLGALFTLGTWLSFQMGQGAFVVYGAACALLGYAVPELIFA